MTTTAFSRRAMIGATMAAMAAPSFGQGVFAGPDAQGRLVFPESSRPTVDFRRLIDRPVIVRSVEQWVLSDGKTRLIRVVSADGVAGVVRASTKAEATTEFHKKFAVPRFTGTDARDVFGTVGAAARDDYEYAGLPYWSAIGQVELAIWDMLGKTARQNCAAMIGPILRTEIPIYMSSNRRDTPPEAEVAHLVERVASTGARAVKLKIGRRMGYNSDVSPGRTERVIALARKTLGDDMTIYADANGAYDSVRAVDIAMMLEDHGVAMFEEPCPFEDFEMTAQVTRAVRAKNMKIKIAGGEQDYALERWRWLIANKAFDVVQPDPMYAGGIARNLSIMAMARDARLDFNPHFPRNGADTAPMLALCAVSPNLYGFQEYRSREDRLDFTHAPMISPKNGTVTLPSGPGWGIDYDDRIWRSATPL